MVMVSMGISVFCIGFNQGIVSMFGYIRYTMVTVTYILKQKEYVIKLHYIYREWLLY